MVIARCPLVFTGGHRGGVATGLLGWLAVDAYFAFTGRSGDGVSGRSPPAANCGEHLAISSWRALIGFSIGGSLGLILGLISGLSRWGERLLDTSIQMLRNVPHLALIPLVILWFGIDESAKIFLVALGTLFPIYINTWHGIRNIDRGLVEMARSYGLSGIPLFIHVILPGALPSIMVGVRFALGLMWLTLIVAETISANSGIGYLAMNAREFLQTDVVVVAIILYALLGKLADVSAQLLERLWLRWNPAYH